MQKDTQFRERFSLISNRVKILDNPFLYGVKSTGIYCLPHCPSKLPKQENVLFFNDAAEAAENGYRPCKRCKPQLSVNLAVDDAQQAIFERAAQFVRGGKIRTVGELALALNISQKQLNRILNKRTGHTARAFLKSTIL